MGGEPQDEPLLGLEQQRPLGQAHLENLLDFEFVFSFLVSKSSAYLSCLFWDKGSSPWAPVLGFGF